MQIDWWTLGLQTVNVLILIWILARFLFRPIAGIVAARQAEAVRLLGEAKAAVAAGQAEHEKAVADSAALAAQRGDLLKAAATDAEAQKAALIAAAHAEIGQLRAAAAAELARAKEGEAVALADRASRLAVDIAAKLMTRVPADLQVTSFIPGLAAGIADLPTATRDGIGQNGAALHLKAARALSDAELGACRRKLAEVLGRPVELAPSIDPSLIAGLEIETPHAVVRNSLRADLDRITTELTRHDHAGK
jgi:F-type H+-transporting ATPase subunit b